MSRGRGKQSDSRREEARPPVRLSSAEEVKAAAAEFFETNLVYDEETGDFWKPVAERQEDDPNDPE